MAIELLIRGWGNVSGTIVQIAVMSAVNFGSGTEANAVFFDVGACYRALRNLCGLQG